MICHKRKIIFIHIPKCAGSSIENYFGVAPFNWKEPNYINLTGWCPERKLHLHHATSRQLLETGLIDKKVWDEYFKFTIVRNPWSRAFSDYIWLNRFNLINTTFEEFINGKGKLSKILQDQSEMTYRGDHLYPQTDFFLIDGEFVLNKILYFENLQEEFKDLLCSLNMPVRELPRIKKSKKFVGHYSHFFQPGEEDLVAQKYQKDIEFLNYRFEDQRDYLPVWRKKYVRIARRFK